MLTRIKINKFTAFEDLDLQLSRGINVFIGANGTGKTHVMKMLYAAMKMANSNEILNMEQVVNGLFLPDAIGRLVKRSQGRGKGFFEAHRQDEGESVDRHIRFEVSRSNKTETVNTRVWVRPQQYKAVFIPVKDMLANAPGFKSLYDSREIYFESIYADIITHAQAAPTRGYPSKAKSEMLSLLQEVIEGRVSTHGQHFYLKSPQGNLEFTLLAEGYRKLGLLYALIQNERLSSSSILFWDEPEANLNPKLAQTVAKIIVSLQRMGTQVFLATHDYVFLRELEMVSSDENTDISYYSFYKENGNVLCQQASQLNEILHNDINDAYDTLLARSIGSNWED